MNNIIENYNYLLKKYFLEEDKFNIYNELYLFLKEVKKEIIVLKKENNKYLLFFIKELEKIKIKINSIINLLNDICYKEWKKIENKEKLKISIKNKEIEIYKRYLNFKIIDHKDPFTEDEKLYCLYVMNKKYKNFDEIPLNIVNIIIRGLIKNVK